MDRNKVLELAREAGLFSTEVHVLMPKLERFAALVEAEMCKHQADKFCETHCSWTDHHVDCDQVRWDAEPVGYTNEGYKGMQYVNAEAYKEIRPDFIERNKLTAPLFAHPAPAVVRQLVEAAERAEDSLLACKQTLKNLDFSMSESSEKVFETVCVDLNSALAAAKEQGL